LSLVRGMVVCIDRVGQETGPNLAVNTLRKVVLFRISDARIYAVDHRLRLHDYMFQNSLKFKKFKKVLKFVKIR